MTINGGQPHKVGYAGQEFKITVYDRSHRERRTIAWSSKLAPKRVLDSLNTSPLWEDARCERVEDRTTGI